MILTTATNLPACYASIAGYYALNRERGEFHTTVVTDGDYAYVSWYGFHSGGEGAFQRRGARWCRLVNTGGAMSVADLIHYGVPRANAERLFAKLQRRRPK
ncbi:MAG TPA: hypothetical protein VN224_15200 [Xanthomonadales bacterium]|nr:hypothetical protein [Xanthomonadales bacterium]